MPVPTYEKFVDPVLRVLAERPNGVKTAEAHELVARHIGLSGADKAEQNSSGQLTYRNRIGWAYDRLKRARFVESAPLGTWRLTEAGTALVARYPDTLPEAEVARIKEINRESQAGGWRERLDALHADASAMAEYEATRETRLRILPEIQKTLQGYLQGTIDLEAFRSTFDRKTRREWSSFGAKGQGGAMVLNQMVKYAPDQARADTALKALLAKPRNTEAAGTALRSFLDYLGSARRTMPGGSGLPQPGRLRFFASSFWHIQDMEQWPPFYKTAREALAADKLYDPDADHDVAEDYLAFREAFLQLQRSLGVSSWELESLLHWTQREEASLLDIESELEESAGDRVWLIALGRKAEHWEECQRDRIIGIEEKAPGDLLQYPSLEAVREAIRKSRDDDTDPVNDGLACWQFAHVMREGDTVYVKKGRHTILGHGVIMSEYRHQPGSQLPNVRSVQWHGQGNWTLRELMPMKALTEIGKDPGLLSDIRASIERSICEDDEPEPIKKPSSPAYSITDAETDLFLEREKILELKVLCRYKKNVILQGPPGVGKTYVATRLAYLLIGSANEEQIERVQFHLSYSYEDFVQGFRPVEGGGFSRQDGPLLRFCKDALGDQASPYVLIIDEINRGNISKILGELLSLIEADKRDPRYGVTLAYARKGEPRFHIPPNLYVIGLMNTADRALAFVDYALRRRFVFVDLHPAFGNDRLVAELTRRGVEPALRRLIRERLMDLNERIASDPSLGPGYQIGHSYFCQHSDSYDDGWYRRIINYEIAPLLREYPFDSPAKLEELLAILQGE